MKKYLLLIILALPISTFASYESDIVHIESETAYMNGCIKSSNAHWNFSDDLCECDDGYTNIGLDSKYFSTPHKIACYPDNQVNSVEITYVDNVKNLYVRFIGDYIGFFVAKIDANCPVVKSDGSFKLDGYYRNSGIQGGKYGYLIQAGEQCNISSIIEIADTMTLSWKKEYAKDLGKKIRLTRDKEKKKILIDEYVKKYEALKTPQGLLKNTMYDYFIGLAQGKIK